MSPQLDRLIRAVDFAASALASFGPGKATQDDYDSSIEVWTAQDALKRLIAHRCAEITNTQALGDPT